MHELSFATQILDRVQQEARNFPRSKVTRVRLSAGELLCIENASLTFCLEAIAAGTVMENAEIEIAEVPLELECAQCGRTPVASALEPHCPRCGEIGTLVAGTDLIIEEIEFNEPDSEA
jgi:hydrogenase nickel incorporation protein HypA/HybF